MKKTKPTPRRKSPSGGPLSALLKVGDAIVSAEHYDEVLHRILAVTRELMNAEICSVRLLNTATGMLELAAAAGLVLTPEQMRVPVRVGEGCSGRAVETQKPFPVFDIKKSPFPFPDLAREQGLRSLLSVPIIARTRVLGALTVYSKRPHKYADREGRVLAAIASQAGIAIENANLHHDSINSLLAMAKAIEAKDPYTQGHSERVTAYAVVLGDALGLPPREVTLLRQLGPLHDVGKIAVPESILRKPGKLTPEEFREIAQHPLIGADILGPIRLFREGLAIVRNHHERVDGNGYPDRLSGDRIPYLARVAAVADAFDAMTSDRSYRKGMPWTEAVDEIVRCSGAQFDADMARCFVEVVRADRDGIRSLCNRAVPSILTPQAAPQAAPQATP